MAQYMQYAVVAAREALDDAGWHPEDPKEQDMTVSLPSILHSICLTPPSGCLYWQWNWQL